LIPFSRKVRGRMHVKELLCFASEEFRRMLELVAKHDVGSKLPSYREIIRVKYLKQRVKRPFHLGRT